MKHLYNLKIHSYQMIKESRQERGLMDLGPGKEIGKIVPLDIIPANVKEEDRGHLVFLLDDPNFKNKIILTPGMLTFTTLNDSDKQIEIYQNYPDALEGSIDNKWRLLDIDELENFYEFYKNGGMGDYDEMVAHPTYYFGSSDLEDVDNPKKSRIYCIDFDNGKLKSAYQYQEKLIIAIREVSDEDIFKMVKDIFERTSFVDFSAVADIVSRMYPNIGDRIKSLGYTDDHYKGARLLRRMGLF